MEQTTLQEEKRDYAVLVGLRSPVLGDDSADEESLAELSALVDTAGGQAVGMILQSKIGDAGYAITGLAVGIILISGVMDFNEIRNSISAPIILMSAGVIGIADALGNTGLTSLVGETVAKMLGTNVNPFVLIFAFFILTSVLATLTGSTIGTVYVFAPMAIATCVNLGLDPTAAAAAIVVSGWCGHFLPIDGMPAMIMGAGDYKITEFWKFTIPQYFIRLLALTVGVLGIVYVSKNGFVNSMEARTFLPSFDLNSLSYISVILFNFLGFEVVCTYADNMQEPRRQIPQAIVTGGIVIAAIYLFSAFGIGAAVPVRDISPDSGLVDAVSLMTGGAGGTLVRVVALLFLVTLFGNMISWSMGVNSTTAYAADRGDMPAVFARRWKRNDMPVGSAVTSGIVASAVCLLGAVMERLSPDSSLFWSFFALNLVMLLLSYLPVFPAFLTLRRKFPDRERPFRVPGRSGFLKWLAYVPMALIILSIIFTAVPLSWDRETLTGVLPITVGSVLSVLLGEVLIAARRPQH